MFGSEEQKLYAEVALNDEKKAENKRKKKQMYEQLKQIRKDDIAREKVMLKEKNAELRKELVRMNREEHEMDERRRMIEGLRQ